MARVFLEEAGFGVSAKGYESLSVLVDDFCDTSSTYLELGFSLSRWSELESETVHDDTTVLDLLYGDLLDRDLRNRFSAILNRCTFWDEANAATPNEFQIWGKDILSCTLSNIFLTSEKTATEQCLGLEWGGEGGVQNVHCVSLNETRSVKFIGDQPTKSTICREKILDGELEANEAYELFPQAFPDLHFHKGLNISAFSQGFDNLLPIVVKHLSGLNDHFRKLIEETSGNLHEVATRMDAIGVPMSPESPNTHRNSRAMREREISINNQTVICEWHTKIQPTIGRIHFHPGIPSFEGGKPIVGIFCDHLST